MVDLAIEQILCSKECSQILCRYCGEVVSDNVECDEYYCDRANDIGSWELAR